MHDYFYLNMAATMICLLSSATYVPWSERERELNGN